MCMYYISTINVNPFIPLVTPGMYLISYTHISTSYLYVPGGFGVCTGDIHKKDKIGRLLQTVRGYGL